MNTDTRIVTRRTFLGTGAAVAAGAVLLKAGTILGGQAASAPAHDLDVTVTEDLMREHGALGRLELVYETVARELQAKPGLFPLALTNALEIEDRFIHSYHEKSEEELIFPVFEKARQQQELVKTLRTQHDAGRTINKRLLKMVHAKTPDSGQVLEDLAAIGRMYRPHAYREDTVLFLEFKKLVTAAQYDEIGEKMEEMERQRLGPDGFEKMVAQIADLEKSLGISDLAQFTPRST